MAKDKNEITDDGRKKKKKEATPSSLSVDNDGSEEAPEGFHPISCIRCRKLHKKVNINDRRIEDL